MSFMDQKSFVLDEVELQKWHKHKPNTFRCFLCGHAFVTGDTARWVYCNSGDSGINTGNCFVCQTCDSGDVLEKIRQHGIESRQRFWWLWTALEDR